jgi:hypothetical protein
MSGVGISGRPRADRTPPRSPSANGLPEELRRWAAEQADRGRAEQSIAQGLGWTVDDVRRAIAERAAARTGAEADVITGRGGLSTQSAPRMY